MGRERQKQKKKHMTIKQAGVELKKNKFLYLMMLPAMIWVLVFCYQPMYGILIAFKKFNYKSGIWSSPWADNYGFGNFRYLFNYYGIGKIFFNTIFLNVLFIATGTIMSLMLALMFVELRNKKLRKVTQSIAIFPHFVTWPVVAMFLTPLIGGNGFITKIAEMITGKDINFYSTAGYWPLILVILKIWQGAGYGTIVYIATITGIDQELYEAAKVDGASRMLLPCVRWMESYMGYRNTLK